MPDRENSHKLLLKQLERSFPNGDYSPEGFSRFISLINNAYESFDESRKLYARVEKISTKELEEINRELHTKNEFLDTFNHGMAHDIKNHTSNIIGLISMLRKYHARNDANMIDTIIDKLDLSANQLTAIVQGFLYLSRVEANIDNQFSLINEQEVVSAVKAETLFLTLGKQCDIRYHFKITDLFFSYHVVKIIFVNLISNSIKFSKKNEPVVIDASLIQHPDKVELIVSDNGVGMNMNDPGNKIFQLFNRTGDNKLIKGTGVGLFMIKKIVGRHDGSVAVKSELNKGTSFSITIPLK